MKILHAVQGWPPEHLGGTELYVQRLARAQSAAGHRVTVAAGSTSDRYDGGFRPQPAAERSPEEGAVGVYRVSQRGSFRERWDHSASPYVENAFAALLEETRPDLVHVHHWLRLTRTLVRRAARSGVPAVLTLHDAAATCPRLFRVREQDFCELPSSVASCLSCVPREDWAPDGLVAEQIRRYNADMLAELEGAAARIAPSRAHAKLLARFSGLPEDRFQVLPHPSSFAEESDPAEAWTPGCGRPLRVAHWGNLVPFKGVHVLLEALALLERKDAVELVLWGRGDDADYEAKLTELSRDLDVERRQAFDREALNDLRADVAVFPTLAHESHSFALDEAFGLRMPVLVSDRGALPERSGAGGLTFPPGDAAALAKLLADVLDGSVRLESLRAELPRGAGIDEHRGALERIYESALARGTGEAPAGPTTSTHGGDRDARDREEWERLVGTLEGRARDLAGLHAAAEREVRGLRKDVSDIFAKLQEDRVELAGVRADLGGLQVRVAEKAAQVHALEVRVARTEHEFAEREAQLWEEIGHRDHRIRKLDRENQLALPLVLPARAVLWVWDRFKRRSSNGPEDAAST